MLTERTLDNVVRQVGVSRQTVIDVVRVLEADNDTESGEGEAGNSASPSLEADTAPVKDGANDNA